MKKKMADKDNTQSRLVLVLNSVVSSNTQVDSPRFSSPACCCLVARSAVVGPVSTKQKVLVHSALSHTKLTCNGYLP